MQSVVCFISYLSQFSLISLSSSAFVQWHEPSSWLKGLPLFIKSIVVIFSHHTVCRPTRCCTTASFRYYRPLLFFHYYRPCYCVFSLLSAVMYVSCFHLQMWPDDNVGGLLVMSVSFPPRSLWKHLLCYRNLANVKPRYTRKSIEKKKTSKGNKMKLKFLNKNGRFSEWAIWCDFWYV